MLQADPAYSGGYPAQLCNRHEAPQLPGLLGDEGQRHNGAATAASQVCDWLEARLGYADRGAWHLGVESIPNLRLIFNQIESKMADDFVGLLLTPQAHNVPAGNASTLDGMALGDVLTRTVGMGGEEPAPLDQVRGLHSRWCQQTVHVVYKLVQTHHPWLYHVQCMPQIFSC